MTNQPNAPSLEERIETTKGLSLNVRAWTPAGSARAIVAIVPGFNSHSGYYSWVGDQLAAAGFATFAVDLRGRGKSDGERFFVDTFTDYMADVDAMVSLARSRRPGLPVFVLGHSAGGVVACLYTLDHQAELAGLISESFAFRVPAPDFVLAALKGLSHLAPHAHVLRLKNEDFSRDPAVVRAMNADPLIANETQPTKTVAEMVRADAWLEQNMASFHLPLLILHGTADKATKPLGSQFFFDVAPSIDKTLKFYDGVFHDPLNDTGKETVLADVSSWIAARLAVPAAARARSASSS